MVVEEEDDSEDAAAGPGFDAEAVNKQRQAPQAIAKAAKELKDESLARTTELQIAALPKPPPLKRQTAFKNRVYIEWQISNRSEEHTSELQSQ